MHPILDKSPYPFHIKEANKFYVTLYQDIESVPQINGLYLSCGPGLFGIESTGAMAVWLEVLKKLAAAGYLKILCDKLRVLQYPRIKACILEMEQVEPVEKQDIIMNDLLMLDRDDFRDHLVLLDDDNSLIKAIVVQGASGSGKSHPHYLLDRFALQQNEYPIYISSATGNTLDRVLRTLFTPVGGPQHIPPEDSTGDAWYSTVCLRLLACAEDTNKKLWIAMDDLGKDKNGVTLIADEVREFFAQFVLHMESAPFRLRFRLLLIHLEKIPVKWKNDFFYNIEVKQDDIKPKHVKKAIESWCKTKGKAVLEDDIIAAADQIIESANQPHEEPRPKRINAMVLTYLKSL